MNPDQYAAVEMETPLTAAADAEIEACSDPALAKFHASDSEKSEFDYIIIGSGAGGGPLASRLALAGKRVLVIEAGRDPAKIKAPPGSPRIEGEATKVPGYYAAASEDPEMSWMFSVRHSNATERQWLDAKYAPQRVERIASINGDTLTTEADEWGVSTYTVSDQTVYVNKDGEPTGSTLVVGALISAFAKDEGGRKQVSKLCVWATDGDTSALWETLKNKPTLNPNPTPEDTQLDPKFRDPHPRHGHKQGVFYPRSSGIGGCTGHHAMITIAPNDRDWDEIANLTGDDSWRAGPMRGYFAKFEQCQYIKAYNGFLSKTLGLLYRGYRRLVLLLDPRAILDYGGHGFKGWAPTNLIDPYLISTIAKDDTPFIKVIIKAALGVIHGNRSLIATLKHQLIRARAVPVIDFNDVNTRRASPEGVFLIPIGTGGKQNENDEQQPGTGTRFGVREFLLNTRRKHPDRLIIQDGTHVTRVLFEKDADGKAPRAVGVECVIGDSLYEASPVQKQAGAANKTVRYFAKPQGGEIILCGGAFNTPQMLMLSGIGDVTHLEEIANASPAPDRHCVLYGKDGQPLPGAQRIHLPGVGRNLQDRYEVTVVSEVNKDFKTLDGVSFEVGDPKDPQRQQWLKDKTGLYATNGGTLAVIRRSKAARETGRPEPDLFTFGAPAAFRGYYWNWSHELFKPTIGATKEERRLWSWVILKAYTNNGDGTVRLSSHSPFDMPRICFDGFNEQAEKDRVVLDARWEAFEKERLELEARGFGLTDAQADERWQLQQQIQASDKVLAHSKRDLSALVDAVSFMREVNSRNPEQFVNEVQPGKAIQDHSPAMEEWIKTQTWGHHASCTCRMGSDSWQADPAELRDTKAVIDSRFSVHGVRGLRIVDASIFPHIPGYFIMAPVFMASEKAADTLLEDATAAIYPMPFQEAEAAAVIKRRQKARAVSTETSGTPVPDSGTNLPEQTIGLAISGGGIRSATFALGVLQTLASRNRLRQIDFMSTVSGGGFIGSFLGRLFTRDSVKRSQDPAGRVQELLSDSSSAPIWWLRTQANYIFATGENDVKLNLAVFIRNIFTVHLVVGTLLLTLFGLLAWLPQAAALLSDQLGLFRLQSVIEPLLTPPVIHGIKLSFWWWLPGPVLILAILPAMLGYWLAPKTGSYRPYSFFSLLAWLTLLLGAFATLQIPNGLAYAGGAAVVLILSWVWQEVARWGVLKGVNTKVAQRQIGNIVRNRLSRGMSEAIFIFVGLLGWVVLDTFAALVAAQGFAGALALVMAALAPILPALRSIAIRAQQQVSQDGKQGFSLTRTANILGIPLAIGLAWIVDVIAHHLFIHFPGWSWGIVITGITAAFSLVIGRAFDFLNLSSLHATYAARVTRTFQGASNEGRIYAPSSDDGRDIQSAHPADDIPFHLYHPEEQGGPLHLINVTVNETVDHASGREIRERKGLPMCIGPHGVSVGRRYFARWAAADGLPAWQSFRRWLDGLDGDDAMPHTFWWIRLCRCLRRRKKRALGQPLTVDKSPALTALSALPVGSDPNAFHVLATKTSDTAEVESLTLGGWTAVSGAAFSTGIGRGTRLPLALFMGIANVRLGYWWDSGIRNEERPGRYPEPLWRRLKRLPVTFFRMQSLLLSEWKGRFHGASRWFWYLSDGGHFEVTGLYPLLRRRVSFMILTDGGEDPLYQWGDLSLLEQEAREDFGANIQWLDFKPALRDVDADYQAWLKQLTPQGQDAAIIAERQKPESQRRAERWSKLLNSTVTALPDPGPWKEWINPDSLGTLNDIRRVGPYHAALAKVTYDGSDAVSWLLVLKPGLSDDLTQDIINYGKVKPDFPQQPTFDQVFNDEQWESYRALGQQIAQQVILPPIAP